ncbi:hypothetical protein [Brevundimonas sp. P7753]|uniref:hypothetical protein n=1 Tax=Brevundimonas sp. P7753 TaxID=2726982 RepID=UPI0015BEE165|nr:hypothetical protein [Brevundimonas sp. P7753]NWE53962.1 hypothetical protein [Brevundimonas sp. P7753]
MRVAAEKGKSAAPEAHGCEATRGSDPDLRSVGSYLSSATGLAWKIQKLYFETISVLIILHEIDELNFVRARICFACSVYNCIPVTELLRLSNKSPSEGLAGCVSLMRGGPVILWELRNASTVQHSHGWCCGHGSCSLRQR